MDTENWHFFPSINDFHCNAYLNRSATPSSAVVQPVPATNPFGTLPALPQMSIGRVGTAPSIQYGISSLPVILLSWLCFVSARNLNWYNFFNAKWDEYEHGIDLVLYQVVDKPAPVRISSLLTSRHLSQRRIRLPARKYHTKNDGPKVRMMLQLKLNLGFWTIITLLCSTLC